MAFTTQTMNQVSSRNVTLAKSDANTDRDVMPPHPPSSSLPLLLLLPPGVGLTSNFTCNLTVNKMNYNNGFCTHPSSSKKCWIQLSRLACHPAPTCHRHHGYSPPQLTSTVAPSYILTGFFTVLSAISLRVPVGCSECVSINSHTHTHTR